jgi:hypothetical protein
MSVDKNADIVIYVEHIVREFDVACILRALLKSRHNLSVDVLPFRFREYVELARHNPRIVAVPAFFAMGPGQRRWFYYWPNARVVNLAYEQIFQRINAPYKKPRSEFALNDLHYSAWGQFYVDYLAGYGVPRENVTVNGHPAYRLYREPYCGMFDTNRTRLAKACGLDPAKRWVFLPENYHAAFFDEDKMSKYVETGVTWEEIRAFRQFGIDSLETFCRWLQKIPEGVEVILRPRPATPVPQFLERVVPLLGGSIPKGLHITNEFSVRDWVLVSDATASSYSTSLIESAVAGKPTFMVETVPFPDLVLNPWYEHIDHIHTQEEFDAMVAGTTTQGSPERLAAWAENEMLAGGDPLVNIADWLAREYADQVKQPLVASPAKVAMRKLGCNFRMLNRKIRAAITKKAEGGNAHDYFTPDEVVAMTDKWAALLGIDLGEPT